MIQTLPLRPTRNGAERAARDQFERSISLGTLELAAAGDPILAHRALGRDADRALVWILPHVELSRPKIRTAHELLGLALGLTTQLADRHRHGRTTPLLSEHSITAHGRIAGAQVFAAGRWLAEGVAPIRVAPEEERFGGATASGDIWRLGVLLSELARTFSLPAEASRMMHLDPEQRPSAEEATEQLDAVFIEHAQREREVC